MTILGLHFVHGAQTGEYTFDALRLAGTNLPGATTNACCGLTCCPHPLGQRKVCAGNRLVSSRARIEYTERLCSGTG